MLVGFDRLAYDQVRSPLAGSALCRNRSTRRCSALPPDDAALLFRRPTPDTVILVGSERELQALRSHGTIVADGLRQIGLLDGVPGKSCWKENIGIDRYTVSRFAPLQIVPGGIDYGQQ